MRSRRIPCPPARASAVSGKFSPESPEGGSDGEIPSGTRPWNPTLQKTKGGAPGSLSLLPPQGVLLMPIARKERRPGRARVHSCKIRVQSGMVERLDGRGATNHTTAYPLYADPVQSLEYVSHSRRDDRNCGGRLFSSRGPSLNYKVHRGDVGGAGVRSWGESDHSRLP